LNFFENKYKDFCENLKNQNKYRKLLTNFNQDDRRLIDFSSNDYLCLSKNFDHEDFLKSLPLDQKNLFGSTGSRLLSGNYEIFDIFEKQIAIDKNTEKALICSSGYQANFSSLNAILDKKVLKDEAIVFFDKSNHASLYQGVLSSGVNLQRYAHSDLDHLEKLLQKYKNEENPKFIITESVFGMDGDISNIEKLVELAAQYDCFLYIDEAHATGVYGEHGYGLCSNIDNICKKYSFDKNNLLIMGTFSKALGSFGAYIAGSEILINFLTNKASGFIYSTALPPILIYSTFYNWKKIRNMSAERNLLTKKANFFRKLLMENDFNTEISNSHIVPIIFGDEEKVLKLKEYFFNKGILVSAIRPPTVQKSCIRVGLNVEHLEDELRKFVNLLKKVDLSSN
jgi:8-amino-7-oxononanoate synthase